MSRPDHDRVVVIGVDLGGTKIAASAFDADGTSFGTAQRPTPSTAGGGAVVQAVAALIADVTAQLPAGRRPRAVGIGSAGVVDGASGAIVASTDAIAGWAGTPLGARVQELSGLPVRVANDVHAHALGARAGLELPSRASLLFIAVGTGIGGALLDGTTVLAGEHGAGGHIGHLPAPLATGLPCSCGSEGHAEAIGSGPAILAAFRREGGTAADTPAVARLARDGHDLARRTIERAATAAGSLTGGLVNAFDPTVVVVSGGVPRIGDLWWASFEAAARRELLPLLRSVPIVLGTEVDAAGLGASRLWFDDAGTHPELETPGGLR